MAESSIKHRDEFETMEGSGECDLAARPQGARHRPPSATTWSRSAPAARSPSTTRPSSGQVELYAILEGEAVLRLDGEDHPAPAGTFASIEPPTTRTILNRSDAPVTALLIGVEPDGGYEPMSWG